MGQKLSDLKGVFGTMEDKTLNEIHISVEGVGFCTENGDVINSSDDNASEGSSDNPPNDGKKSKSGWQKRSHKSKDSGKKKRPHWVLKFNCARLKSGSNSSGGSSEPEVAEPNIGIEPCVCTGYRRTEDHGGVVFEAAGAAGANSDSEGLRHDEYPIEDCDERARIERAREIAEGVDPPPGFRPRQHIQLVCPQDMNLDSLTALLQSAALSALSQWDSQRVVHTQVDYIHCLVPDLLQITSCSFYWGKMDRYEAERLLDGKPEGTFLLRDSAQEEYLFSVSFRKYGRSLHARIEQWKHMFSFDSHDPGVFSSPTVCGLIEHYKDPSCCMFFEPVLTIPLHRNFAFPLQHLSRAVICSRISYDGISLLKLPKALKGYLKEYHYKQRVKVRRFDSEQ
ncbi:hypothetical protein AAG570_001868 [Ranatra chinensis]|uniref:Suppressor of cytokine signaling 5 n=1 Tax=Ranatra chinensis TaxID=642074 RepID=A0ABD0Y9U1_9HEMI